MSYFDLKNCFIMVSIAKNLAVRKTIANLVRFVECLGFVVLEYYRQLVVPTFMKLELLEQQKLLLEFAIKVQLVEMMISNWCLVVEFVTADLTTLSEVNLKELILNLPKIKVDP